MNILVSFIFISSFTFFEDYAFLFLISALFAYINLFSNIKKKTDFKTNNASFTIYQQYLRWLTWHMRQTVYAKLIMCCLRWPRGLGCVADCWVIRTVKTLRIDHWSFLARSVTLSFRSVALPTWPDLCELRHWLMFITNQSPNRLV